jgi:hypothetical protein
MHTAANTVMGSVSSARPRFSASAANFKNLLPVPMYLDRTAAAGSELVARWM